MPLKRLGIRDWVASFLMGQFLQPESRFAMKKSLFALSFLTATLRAPRRPARAAAPAVGRQRRGRKAVQARRHSRSHSTTTARCCSIKKEWNAAQQQLEAALAINEKMAEAHNNLAYVLRKQGAANYAKSLEHYNRAIELKPKLAEAYMYRGALHALSGQAGLARADYDQLVKMKSKLAPSPEEGHRHRPGGGARAVLRRREEGEIAAHAPAGHASAARGVGRRRAHRRPAGRARGPHAEGSGQAPRVHRPRHQGEGRRLARGAEGRGHLRGAPGPHRRTRAAPAARRDRPGTSRASRPTATHRHCPRQDNRPIRPLHRRRHLPRRPLAQRGHRGRRLGLVV